MRKRLLRLVLALAFCVSVSVMVAGPANAAVYTWRMSDHHGTHQDIYDTGAGVPSVVCQFYVGGSYYNTVAQRTTRPYAWGCMATYASNYYTNNSGDESSTTYYEFDSWEGCNNDFDLYGYDNWAPNYCDQIHNDARGQWNGANTTAYAIACGYTGQAACPLYNAGGLHGMKEINSRYLDHLNGGTTCGSSDNVISYAYNYTISMPAGDGLGRWTPANFGPALSTVSSQSFYAQDHLHSFGCV